jgi:prepilin-type N-terminal cleavage/methylation domain-containing protein
MSLARSPNRPARIRLRPRERSGFTLIELAVVLVIMGLVGWLFYGSIFGLAGKEKLNQADRDLRTVQSTLQGLAVANRGLPDPRSPGSVAAYPDAGLLPANVTPQRDPWGQDILYFAARELAGNGTLPGALSTSLRVRTYAGVGSGGTFPAGDAPLDRVTENVAFVLLSRGKNLLGQATVDVAGGITTLNLLRVGGPMNDGSGLEYDDLVRFSSLEQLKAQATR